MSLSPASETLPVGGSFVGQGIGVSGGGSHLGRAIALGLAAAGAQVVIFGRREEPLKETASFAANLPGEVFFEVADQHHDEDLGRVLDRIEREAGRVRGWVNNAYSGPNSQLMQLERGAVEESIAGALSDVILATEAAAKRMLESDPEKASAASSRPSGSRDVAVAPPERGAIVNVASMYGMVAPQPDAYVNHPQFHNPPAYGAAKAGVIQFTKTAACHLARDGVRVNCVSPGPFPTQNVRAENGFMNELERRVPLGRVGEAHELAGPVAFLLSRQASFITGHNLVVDGGWTTW